MAMSVSGEPLSDRRVRAGLRANIVAGSFGMMWFAMCMSLPLTMFMDALNASGKQIGLIATTQQFATMIQVPASALSERLAERKTYWAALAMLHRMLWFLPALMLLLMPGHYSALIWATVIIVSLSAILAQASAGAWYSWMADLVPKATSGRFWGLRQSVVMAAFLVTVGLTGWLLDSMPTSRDTGMSGFAVVFCIGALLGMADIIVHLRVPEPRQRLIAHDDPLWQRLVRPLRDADFRWLTLSVGVWQFSLGMVGMFTPVFLKREFNVTFTELSAMNIAASIGTVVASVPLGYVIDKVGARAFAAIMFIAGPAFGGFWFLISPTPITLSLPLIGTHIIPQPVLMFTITNLVAGALYSSVGLCQMNLLTSLAPQQGRTLAMAVHFSVANLIGAMGPVVGGWLMDHFSGHDFQLTLPFGAHFSYMHVLVVAHMATSMLICVPLILRIRTKAGELSVTTALARLRVGNPLRALIDVYNIYMVVAPSSSEQRAGALRRLGDSRSEIAIAELIEKLDDPSADVREEAVMALGKIGSAEAVQALIARLENPESDLAPTIARALRASPSPAPQSVDALLNKLTVADRETATESARTLGAIGDPRAAQSLLELLRSTDDAKVLSASSEALGRLGQLAAIHEIIPHLKTTRNPVLKRSLAIAVADLLGRPGEFYKILTAELHSSGTEVETLLNDLARDLRRGSPKAMRRQVDHFLAITDRLATAYDANDTQQCADQLFDLAIGMVAILYGIDQGGDARAVIDDLIWRDEQVAIGIWFLVLLRDRGEERSWPLRDRTDILIGIYFVSTLIRQLPKSGEAPGTSE